MKQIIISICVLLLAGCTTKSVIYNKSSKSTSEQSDLSTRSSASFKYNLQPYTVNGKTYNPTFVNVGEEFNGIASWYGPDFHGKTTANGEVYDMYAMTAAHKTLPINTIIKVENQTNQKNVTVRINDRGPFVAGRIVDLSFSAGKLLGLDKTGTAPVKLTVLGFDGKIDTMQSNMQVQESNFGVQIGAFKNKASADSLALQVSSASYKAIVKTYSNDEQALWRVILSGFRSLDEARDFAKSGKYNGAFALSLN